MIAKSLEIIRSNLWFYLFFAALMLGLTALSYSGIFAGSIGITTLFLWQLFIRFVTRSALFGVRFTEKNPDGSNDNVVDSFVLKAIGLAVASFIVAFPFMLIAFWNQVLATEDPTTDVFISIMIILFVSYSVVLGLAGSWLPASLGRERRGLTDAIRRAPSTFLPVFVRVLPTLLLGTLAQIPVVMMGMESPVGGVIFSAVAILIQCASATLVAVILTHYYQQHEGRAPVGTSAA